MTTRRKEFTGSDAWRNGFSEPAADLLAIQLAFCWDLETFVRALVLCGKMSKAERANESTVLKVIEMLANEDAEYVARTKAAREAALARMGIQLRRGEP